MHSFRVHFTFFHSCQIKLFHFLLFFPVYLLDCLTKTFKSFFSVSDCCKCESIRFSFHLHLYMVSLQKDIIQLRSCQCRIDRRKNQFRTVIIKNTIYILFRICQTDISALRKPLSCLFQHFCKFTEHFMTFCCHRIDTCIDTCHKNIRRAARLIDSHKSPNNSSIHSATAVMKNCSLRHSRKRFVKALDYKVCSKFHC